MYLILLVGQLHKGAYDFTATVFKAKSMDYSKHNYYKRTIIPGQIIIRRQYSNYLLPEVAVFKESFNVQFRNKALSSDIIKGRLKKK